MKQRVGTIPMERKRIGGVQPCESCGYRKATIKLTMPVGKGVTHRLCKTCDPKQ